VTPSRASMPKPGTMGVSPIRPTVVAAIRDPEWRVHVSVSLAQWSSLTVIDDPRELPVAAARSEIDIALWHLDSGDDVDDDCVNAVRCLRRASPGVVLIVYCEISHAIAPLLLAAGRVGADRVLVRGSSSLLRGLQEALASDESRRYARFVIGELGLPVGSASTALSRSLGHARAGPFTVEWLAHDLGVSRQTLASWLRDAQLPVPERLIGWSRILMVARLLEDAERPINAIARTLQFSSVSDLRHLVGRYTGCTPTQLRGGGGVTVALAMLRSEIGSRHQSPEPAGPIMIDEKPSIRTPALPINPLR
jgi:AraC-like DNA-binding protein